MFTQIDMKLPPVCTLWSTSDKSLISHLKIETSLNSSRFAGILLIFWTLVLQFYICGNIAHLLDSSITVEDLREFCSFFGL